MLSERRKADRETMLNAVRALAAEVGASLAYHSPRERRKGVTLIGARGLCVDIRFDGASPQPDVHVVSWYINSASGNSLAPSFGNVNPYHHRKATAVAHGFPALLEELRRGFTLANNGKAFQESEYLPAS